MLLKMAADLWLLGHFAPGTSWSSPNLLSFSKWLPIHITWQLGNHCQLAPQNGCLWTLFKAILYQIQTLLAIQNGCQSIFTWPLNSSHSLIQSRPDQLLKMAAHLYLLGHLGNPSQATSQNGCQSIFTWPLNSSHSLIQSRPDNLLKMDAINETVCTVKL